jgi:serine phosphatase RsbU (regulator of sigma subunit)
MANQYSISDHLIAVKTVINGNKLNNTDRESYYERSLENRSLIDFYKVKSEEVLAQVLKDLEERARMEEEKEKARKEEEKEKEKARKEEERHFAKLNLDHQLDKYKIELASRKTSSEGCYHYFSAQVFFF